MCVYTYTYTCTHPSKSKDIILCLASRPLLDTIVINIHARVYSYMCVYIYIHMYIPHRIERHTPVFSPLHCIRTQCNVHTHIRVFIYVCIHYIHMYLPHRIERHNPVFSLQHHVRTINDIFGE